MHPGRRQGRRTLAGALLILGLAVIAAAIFLLDDIRRALAETYTIVGLFSEARALEAGTPVWIAGRPAGSVVRVDVLPPDADTTERFAATLRLPVEHMPLIRRDSELDLAASRLLGDPVVNLMPGTLAAPMLRPGDTLVAVRPPTLDATLAAADTLRQAFDSLTTAVDEVRLRARRRAPAVRRLTASVRAAERELDALAAAVERGPLGDLLADSAALAAFGRLRTATEEIADLVDARLDQVRDPALNAALRRLGRRTALLRRRIDALRALLDEPRGFPGRWRTDPALRGAVRAARAQLDSLIAELRSAPWRWIF